MGFQWEFVLPLSIAHFTVYINTDPTPQRAAHNPHKTQHTESETQTGSTFPRMLTCCAARPKRTPNHRL